MHGSQLLFFTIGAKVTTSPDTSPLWFRTNVFEVHLVFIQVIPYIGGLEGIGVDVGGIVNLQGISQPHSMSIPFKSFQKE
jgi:hypothetical protein